MRDNLGPKGQLRFWNNPTAKFPFNNRGEVAPAPTPTPTPEPTPTPTPTPEPTDWRAGLDPSIRDHPGLADLKTPADVAMSWVESQKLIGKDKIPVPSKDSDPMQEGGNKEFDMVYDRMGRPSDPKAYALPEGLEIPQGFPAVAEETVTAFKEFSHKIGLLPHQVKALYQWQHEQALGVHKGNTEATATALQTSEAALRKEYGKKFDGNLNAARGLIQKFGGEEVLGIMESTGLGNNPAMIKFMVNVANQFTEDGNIQLGDTQPAIFTPEEAKVEVDKIMADKAGAYWNPTDKDGKKKFSDKEHDAMVKKVSDLNEMAFPAVKT